MNPEFPWPHAPPHWTFSPGIYFVTASTYHRERLFHTPELLDVVTGMLVESAEEFGWGLMAWAVMSNHYHFLANSPSESGESLSLWLKTLHGRSARKVNQIEGTPGRRVWMNYWDTRITYQNSFLARLRYVNQNPVKHGLVEQAEDYRWCSEAWFVENAPMSFVESVARFKIDRVHVVDDFES